MLFQIFFFSQRSAGEADQFIESLPNNIKFEFSKTINILNEKTETEMYMFEIKKFPFFMLKTDNLPDCVLVPINSYGGGEIYKRLQDNSFQRIIEVRDHDKNFAIFYIDEDNNSKKLLEISKENSNMISSLIYGYGFYWNGISKK